MDAEKAIAVLKARLQGLSPSLGNVYTTLLAKFDPADVATDLLFDEPGIGKIVKAFVIRPGACEEFRHGTGRSGYSLEEQEIVITGFVSVHAEQATERVLENEFKRIRANLRNLATVDEANDPDAFSKGRFVLTPVDRVKIAEHLCHFKELRLMIEDRLPAVAEA